MTLSYTTMQLIIELAMLLARDHANVSCSQYLKVKCGRRGFCADLGDLGVDCLEPICLGAAEVLLPGGFLALETAGGAQAR